MKVYSKYLIIFSVTFLLCSLLHIGLFYYNLGKPEPSIEQLSQRFLKKDNYAQSIKERKIMFISGSNTLFGVDTEKLENALHIPVVNYGTHAGLPTYNFQRAKHNLNTNDIVVLPLEYSFYTYHKGEWSNIDFVRLILAYDTDFFYELSLKEKIMAITQVETKDLLKLTFKKFSPSPLAENTLDVNDLNTNGDVINYYSKQQETGYALLGKIPRTLFKEPPLSTDAQEALIDFIDYCNTHNITIYAAWPNFLWYDKKFSGNELDGIHAIEKFYIEHNVEILGDYTDCLYEAELFYDSPNHLNAEGKRIHTEYLINILQNKLFK